MPTSQDRILASLGHIGYIVGLPVLLPLVLYVWKRQSAPFVAEAAKQALALHVATVAFITLALLFSFGTLGLGMFVAIPAVSLFLCIGILCSIVAVIKVADGRAYRYPLIGRMFDGI